MCENSIRLSFSEGNIPGAQGVFISGNFSRSNH
jgi:hypothetical protein